MRAARRHRLKEALDLEPDARFEPLRADLRTDAGIVGSGSTAQEFTETLARELAS